MFLPVYFAFSRVLVQFIIEARFLRNMDDMNKESLLNWLKENFNDDIASKFEGKSYWNTKLNLSAK